jgi:hypothetical protein
MGVRMGVLYGCKHLYEVVKEVGEGSRFYTIVQCFTLIFTPMVWCKYGVINKLQRHFTLFYTFYIVNVKTRIGGCKKMFTFFYFYKNILCTILYIYYIQSV